MNGIINLFKPKGITSHDAVNSMRKILGIKRIGHTGTLDPNAFGVLPLCIGKATRISEYLLNIDKEYVAELTLGKATDTQDIDGKVVAYSPKQVKERDIYEAFKHFQGKIRQVPPMFSAIKQDGKKLYELAREGKHVRRDPREVYIYDLKIYDIIDNKRIIFYVRCSKGTYIRTLCDDIGKYLGTYGYMSYLARVGVGNFKIQDSCSIEYIKSLNKKELETIIQPMDKGLNHLPSLTIENKFYKKLINGAIVPMGDKISEIECKNKPLRIYCKGEFIGIGRIVNKDNFLWVKMDKVLI